MAFNAKHFAERLNRCLSDTDAPAQLRERAAILSKLLDIPRQDAWSFLEGHQVPHTDILERIADEFEVDPNWLVGEK